MTMVSVTQINKPIFMGLLSYSNKVIKVTLTISLLNDGYNAKRKQYNTCIAIDHVGLQVNKIKKEVNELYRIIA